MKLRHSTLRILLTLYPRLASLPHAEQDAAAGYATRALVFSPLAIAALIWLAQITDLAALTPVWPLVIIAFVLMFVLSRLWFQTFYRTEGGGYRSEGRSFWGEVLWSAVLVAGPTVAWLGVILVCLNFLLSGLRGSIAHRLRILSRSLLQLAIVFLTLLEAHLYQALGGRFPMRDLSLEAVLPAVGATLVGFSLGSLLVAGAMSLVRAMAGQIRTPRASGMRFVMQFGGPFIGLVAILPAGLYSLAGWGGYLAFWLIMLGATLTVDRLSRTLEAVQRRTAEMAELEHFSRDVIRSEPDIDFLAKLLAEHAPQLFPDGRISAVLYPDRSLLHYPADWPVPLPPDFQMTDRKSSLGGAGLIAPIIMPGATRPAGHIYLEAQNPGEAGQLMPALQSLSGQVASALLRLDVTQQFIAERVARERVDRELALGARIQASLLPNELPQFDRWRFTATLIPARETSGDFYDVFSLGSGRLGLVVADVADKGLGAAFYMALSLTLLRTYAVESAIRYGRTYHTRIGEVLEAINKRLIQDTNGETFVTLFYGVLDLRSGKLWYANAGHNPPFVIRRDKRRSPLLLKGTGMALGVFEYQRWRRRSLTLEEGDLLVAYSDGLTEAMNEERELWGEARLIQAIGHHRATAVEALQEQLLAQVYDFMGGAPQHDDITLLLVRRER
ncbi:MAG: PP2C family protein-serine/threonine phosphatase [Anaerolineaceae bacterium]|nr:PP2C family protein-serine/threonine phosphatase [Anaerolineaceae bacterium]